MLRQTMAITNKAPPRQNVDRAIEPLEPQTLHVEQHRDEHADDHVERHIGERPDQVEGQYIPEIEIRNGDGQFPVKIWA